LKTFERISRNPNICHGKACIKGTRILVNIILHEMASGKTLEEIIQAYPVLTRKDILAAIAYASIVVKER
jgi:uncharacterized protein (DUF433 family)